MSVLNSKVNKLNDRLWIGNLDSKFREFKLLKLVEKFGALSHFDYLYHQSGPQAGQPRGYAFVTYKDLESASNAAKALDGIIVNGRKLAVKWAHEQDESRYLVVKKKAEPSVLKIKTNESSQKEFSTENKIAALEAKLQAMEEKKLSVDVSADIGESSKPTSITYNYIERKSNNFSYSRPRHKLQPYHRPDHKK